MMGSNTNCKNVCAVQETIMSGSCELRAAGNEIKASSANRYAAHMEPTDLVTNTATRLLKRPIGLSPCTTLLKSWSKTNPWTCVFVLAVCDSFSITPSFGMQDSTNN